MSLTHNGLSVVRVRGSSHRLDSGKEPQILPVLFLHSSTKAAECISGYSAFIYDPSIMAMHVPCRIDSAIQLLSPSHQMFSHIHVCSHLSSTCQKRVAGVSSISRYSLSWGHMLCPFAVCLPSLCFGIPLGAQLSKASFQKQKSFPGFFLVGKIRSDHLSP